MDAEEEEARYRARRDEAEDEDDAEEELADAPHEADLPAAKFLPYWLSPEDQS